SAQGRARLSELQVTKAGLHQELKRLMDSRLRAEEFRGFFDRELEQIADALPVVRNGQRSRVEPLPATRFAWDIAGRQEIHFQFDHSLACAGFTTASFRVKGEAAPVCAADPG